MWNKDICREKCVISNEIILEESEHEKSNTVFANRHYPQIEGMHLVALNETVIAQKS